MDIQLERVQSLFSAESPAELEAIIQAGRREGYRGFYGVPGFSSLYTLLPDTFPLIEPPSSDEDSDSERSGPTVRTVTEAILDSQMTKISVKVRQDEFVPCEYQCPALIFFHLDGNMTSKDLSSVFSPRYSVAHVQMVDFAGDSGFSHCGIVYFRHQSEAIRLYSRLKSEEANGTLGSRLHAIAGAQRMVNVKWIRNEARNKQADWSAVVIRNLPQNLTVEAVLALFNTRSEKPVLRIEPPRTIQGRYCTIAVTKSFEDAIKVAKRLNNTRVSTETIKVHVHPASNKGHSILAPTPPKRTKSQSMLLEKLMSFFPQENGSKASGPVFEPGEIPDVNHQAYLPPVPVSRFYTLYEFPGVSYGQSSVRLHSGMQVMTTHVNDEADSAGNEERLA